MLIRFNRSAAVREAYRLYDHGDFAEVIRLCTRHLLAPNADPELRLLRGVAYLDRNQPNEAVADWRACCSDPHIAGVAHYYLGDFLSTQLVEHEPVAWTHYTKAVEFGWVEGHIGRGKMLLDRGLEQKNSDQLHEATVSFRDAIQELGIGLCSPSVSSKRRALAIRGNVFFHLDDTASRVADRDAQKALPPHVEASADPRATGAEQYQ